MKVTCKCHGVSGSCSLITCWQQLAPFRKVGDHLQDKYGDATRVKTTRSGRLRVRRKASNIPTANDLVFLHRSPNYCHVNDTIGSLGMSMIAMPIRLYNELHTLQEPMAVEQHDSPNLVSLYTQTFVLCRQKANARSEPKCTCGYGL